MLDTLARLKLQKYLIDPVARYILKIKYLNSPEVISYLAGILGLLVCFLLWLNKPYWAILFLLLSGYMDILDGTLARMLSKQSPFGAVLDIMMDRFVEAAVIFGLYLYLPISVSWVLLLMLISSYLCVTSFLVVAIFSEKLGEKSFYYSPGLMERAEAFVFFIAIVLLPSWVIFLGVLYSILVLYTAIKRVYEFKSNINIQA